jgi:hypothetical protein
MRTMTTIPARAASASPGLALIALGGVIAAAASPVVGQPCPGVWGTLGTGTNSDVRTLCTLSNGDLIAGGLFTIAGGVSANRIARWDGAVFSPLGSGVGSGEFDTVLALATLPNGDLIAGGLFTIAGGVSANRIARWDGTAWNPLGTGTTDTVRAVMTLSNGDLVAGGQFLTAGGLSVHRIARWNGTAWGPLGSGMNDAVYALAALPNGDLIAGGSFTTAGGMSANNIARWNGSAWSPMGTGMNSPVLALATLPNGDVVAGGMFTIAGGVLANYIARWDGIAWSPLGTGMNGGGVSSTVYALNSVPSGDLVVGGEFTMAGGLTVNRVVRWDGAAWNPLGSGIGSIGVYSLVTLPSGDLVAGGPFFGAGQSPAANIARWSTAPTVASQPHGATVCPTGIGSFSVTAAPPAGGPFTYQWQIQATPTLWQTLGNDPFPLPCGGFAFAVPPGAAMTHIGIRPCPGGGVQHFQIRCVVANHCGYVTSNEATYTDCPVDENCDGSVSVQDFLEFLTLFSAADALADFNGDGLINLSDFLSFLAAYSAGC